LKAVSRDEWRQADVGGQTLWRPPQPKAGPAREGRGSGALRVPEVALAFWIVKALSTALGEGASDALVNSSLGAQIAVVLGFFALLGALIVQFKQARYRAWPYWTAVCMVGVFGTMAADVMHVALHVPYTASSIFYALVLAAVFTVWRRTERTLDIHSIDTPRREAFYWAAVVATFAMGTAVGDLTAVTLKFGYWPSAALFAGLILIPLAGWKVLHANPVLCFWSAYVLTRPLGASIADASASRRTSAAWASVTDRSPPPSRSSSSSRSPTSPSRRKTCSPRIPDADSVVDARLRVGPRRPFHAASRRTPLRPGAPGHHGASGAGRNGLAMTIPPVSSARS